MDSFTPEFIEKYQQLYESDPHSKVFAPLAEAFRKSGDLQKAYSICKKGVTQHPSFASGHLSMARIYKDLKELDRALQHLRRAVQLAPENIQAHSLIAELCVTNRKPKEALAAFKQVLLLNPRDEKAKSNVKKLESLTASDFDSDTFQLGNLFDHDLLAPEGQPVSLENRQKAVSRIVTLIDALIIRNEFEKAQNTLDEAIQKYGVHKEFNFRQTMIDKQKEKYAQVEEAPALVTQMPSGSETRIGRYTTLRKKISYLNVLLHRAEATKSVPFKIELD